MSFRQVLFLVGACTVRAATFLGNENRISKEMVEQALLLKSVGADGQLKRLQEELAPMYISMPKNAYGRMETASVRYALHRYFVHKHGWYVKGLDPAGGSWDSSSDGLLKEWAPAYIQNLFEKRLQGRGFTLEDMSSFAATVAHLIHSEGIDGLEAVYNAMKLPLHGEVSGDQFDIALRGYLSVTIVGQGVKMKSTEDIDLLENESKGIYPEYDDIVMWIRDMIMDRKYFDPRRNPFVQRGISFEFAVDFMKALLHNFGGVTRTECGQLKHDLVQMEEDDNGRLPLSSFFANTEIQMHESVDYLRNLGVLEETGLQRPRLVIPNYISSPCRCVPFSGYFSVCCPDECESLMSSVEGAMQAPGALPERIAQFVSTLPSDTVDAPRNLSSILVTRLDEIAARHGGHVPLHGRLFMQWMHHAFPRECPYPHAAGTVKPVSQDEWLIIHDDIDDAMATHEERMLHIGQGSVGQFEVGALPWTSEEELVAVHVQHSALRSTLRPIMVVVLLTAFAVPLSRASSKLFGAPERKPVHMV